MFCEIPEFDRACLCMPLRHGILTFGYVNVIWSLIVIWAYWSGCMEILKHAGLTGVLNAEICLAISAADIFFNAVLLYGTHRKQVPYVTVFYYYAWVGAVVTSISQGLQLQWVRFGRLESVALMLAILILQLYLILLVRSFIKKLSTDGPNAFESRLHDVMSGATSGAGSGAGVYAETVVINGV